MPARAEDRGGPQRGEQVVQEQHGLAGGDADDIAARVDPPAFAKTDEHDVFLFGVDEYIANVLQAGQEDNLFGQGLAGLQRLFNGFFQPAERDLAERSGGIEVGRDLLDQAGPLGPELAKHIDAGILDESIGLDRDAADRLLVTVADYWASSGAGDCENDGRGKKSIAAGKTLKWRCTDGWLNRMANPFVRTKKAGKFRKFLRTCFKNPIACRDEWPPRPVFETNS